MKCGSQYTFLLMGPLRLTCSDHSVNSRVRCHLLLLGYVCGRVLVEGRRCHEISAYSGIHIRKFCISRWYDVVVGNVQCGVSKLQTLCLLYLSQDRVFPFQMPKCTHSDFATLRLNSIYCVISCIRNLTEALQGPGRVRDCFVTPF